MFEDLRNDIIKTFHLESLSPEQQDLTISSLASTVLKAAMAKVLGELSEVDLTEYNALLDLNPTPDELAIFLQEKTPEFRNIVDRELIKLFNSNEAMMTTPPPTQNTQDSAHLSTAASPADLPTTG